MKFDVLLILIAEELKEYIFLYSSMFYKMEKKILSVRISYWKIVPFSIPNQLKYYVSVNKNITRILNNQEREEKSVKKKRNAQKTATKGI
jgi:hypothetical protein